MTSLKLIGDVHGKLASYEMRLHRSQGKTFQVGDMGLGFPDGKELQSLSPNDFFIRGNHDNPAVAKAHPNYAGEFGYWEKEKLFFIGGAYSIDIAYRLEYEKIHGKKIWWFDEELFQEQLEEAFDLYKAKLPKIVISHTCPESIASQIIEKYLIGSPKKNQTRTESMLERMFQFHQPDTWVFGHWHMDLDFRKHGTRFICLAELSTILLQL